MEKKTVIVTGGNGGIGKASALAFAQQGYNVVITGRNSASGEEVAQQAQAFGVEAVFKQVDIRQEEEVKKLVDETVQQFGKLDAFVNNAGIPGKENGLLADCSTDNFRELLETNVLGLFYGVKYAIQAMLQTGGGSIVNLASIAGAHGVPHAAQYCASKHAVVGLTKSAAVEYATQGIRVNAIAPGAIKTDILNTAIKAGAYDETSIAALHPMNRLGTVEDIANGIVYLASDASPFMTGNILFVDGGFTAK